MLKSTIVWPVLAIAAFFAGLPAFAAGISFTCAANIDSTAAGTCATLNSTVAGYYSSAFTNANADIYIGYGTTGLGQSTQFKNTVSYSAYRAALVASQTSANDATAIASLGSSTTVNPVVAADGVSITSALGAALGLSGYSGIMSDANTSCTIGTSGCYNGVITLTDTAGEFYYRSGSQASGTYDFFTVVQHEVDEVLGTPSCLRAPSGTPLLGCGAPTQGVGAVDLFRYSAAGTRSFLSTANGTTAYFSIDGGTTSIAGYNNSPNGADYGDFDSAVRRVQNAFGTPSVSGTNIDTPEITLLDVIGYNTSAPEPGTVVLFSSALIALAGFARRRKA